MSKPFRRKGSQVWYVRINGVRKSTGTASLEDAKAYLAKLTKEAWEQERMGIKPPRSWEESVVRYLKEVSHQPSIKWKVAVLREWGKHFEGKSLQSITRDRVDDLLDPTPEASPHNHTLNKKVAILHHVLTKACREWDWLERHPKFRIYPIPPHREDWLTPEQWMAFEAELPEDLRQFCKLALATGLRSGAILGLQWSHYDPIKRILDPTGTTRKRVNPIPLNDAAMSILEARRGAHTVRLGRIFHEFSDSPIKQRWHVFERIRKIPGLEHAGVHVLRHTFCTWLAQSGVPRELRMYLMGHSAAETHEIYTHWAYSRLMNAVKVIDEVLAAGRISEKAHTLLNVSSVQ